MHELDGSDVEPSRRLRGDEKLGVAPELARDDDLLLVAAGEIGGVDRLARRPDVEGGDALASDVAHGLAVENPVLGQWRLAVIAKAMFSTRSNSRTSPRRCRSAGMCETPASMVSAGSACVMSLPLSETVPDDGRRRPMMASTIWLWPLPSTPAMPTISPSCTSNDTPRTASSLRSSSTCRSLTLEHDIAGRRRLLVDPEHDLAADHHLGKPGLVGLARRGLPHQPTRAHDDDAVGERHDLVELVGDDHDRESRVDELADDLEELVDLLRGEHRRGLVENEHARLAEERLEDLDPLLHADRQVLDQRVGIDLEPVALGDRDDLCRARWPCR